MRKQIREYIKDLADNHERNFDYLTASMLNSWVKEIDDGATLNQVKQMYNVAKRIHY